MGRGAEEPWCACGKTVWFEAQAQAACFLDDSHPSYIPAAPLCPGIFGDCPFEGVKLEMGK
jgi:hypothetical protein